jgi:hypothetical protein
MTPRKPSSIGMLPIGELMHPLVLNRRQAMLGQRKVKPEAFPVGNRAARRLGASRKAKERPL